MTEQQTIPVPYRANPSPAICPECSGRGVEVLKGAVESVVCRECGGTGRQAA